MLLQCDETQKWAKLVYAPLLEMCFGKKCTHLQFDGQVTCHEECISLILIQYFCLWHWVFLMFSSPHFIDFWGIEWEKCKVIYSSLLSYKFSVIAFPRESVSIRVGDFTFTQCELCPSQGGRQFHHAGQGCCVTVMPTDGCLCDGSASRAHGTHPLGTHLCAWTWSRVCCPLHSDVPEHPRNKMEGGCDFHVLNTSFRSFIEHGHLSIVTVLLLNGTQDVCCFGSQTLNLCCVTVWKLWKVKFYLSNITGDNR